jgi:hypothetical protein
VVPLPVLWDSELSLALAAIAGLATEGKDVAKHFAGGWTPCLPFQLPDQALQVLKPLPLPAMGLPRPPLYLPGRLPGDVGKYLLSLPGQLVIPARLMADWAFSLLRSSLSKRAFLVSTTVPGMLRLLRSSRMQRSVSMM